jgi:hypothetical protein
MSSLDNLNRPWRFRRLICPDTGRLPMSFNSRPRVEGENPQRPMSVECRSFNPRPREGRRTTAKAFNPRPLRAGDPTRPASRWSPTCFNPRPLREGRRCFGSVRSEVASGRSLHQDEWDPALLVAGRGPERSGHRYHGTAAPGPLGSFAFLS